MSSNQKRGMKSLAELAEAIGQVPSNTSPSKADNASTLGKPADNQKTGPLCLTLKRTMQLKRYPVIAKVTFLRERQDLVSLLKAMQTSATSMPSRLRAYLKQEALWDESGITGRGQQVIDTGLFHAKERGLYHIWYTDNDPLLGTRPVMLQRDTAFFEPKLNAWKKGADAARSEFRVEAPLQMKVLEGSFVDRKKSELKNISLQMESLEPEVICSPDKTAEIPLEWTLGLSSSKVSLKGQLDILKFSQNKPSPHPQALELAIDGFGDRLNELMDVIAHKFDGHWQPKQRRIATQLEQIKRYPSSVQKFHIGSYDQNDLKTDLGEFQCVQAKHIPIQPANQSDAVNWRQCWLEDYHSKHYRSSADARKQQSEWLDHLALNEFELPLKEHQFLLSELSRESQSQAYWHIAAMADLTPSKSRKLRMPISLVNGDLLNLNQLIEQLTGGESIQQVIYSDRYVHTSRQSRNLSVIAECLAEAKGLLLTLDKQHEKEAMLPESWIREILQKQSENHGRYWIMIANEHTWCWECSSGLDFIRENNGHYSVDGSPTFTPKEVRELPRYLREKINNTASEAH